MAAEYGVIGEISRGSSTAANARERRLSSRRFSLFLSISFSPFLSFPLSLSFYPALDPYSVIQLADALSLLLPHPPSAFILFVVFFLFSFSFFSFSLSLSFVFLAVCLSVPWIYM